jgi:hypothetical protein
LHISTTQELENITSLWSNVHVKIC